MDFTLVSIPTTPTVSIKCFLELEKHWPRYHDSETPAKHLYNFCTSGWTSSNIAYITLSSYTSTPLLDSQTLHLSSFSSNLLVALNMSLWEDVGLDCSLLLLMFHKDLCLISSYLPSACFLLDVSSADRDVFSLLFWWHSVHQNCPKQPWKTGAPVLKRLEWVHIFHNYTAATPCCYDALYSVITSSLLSPFMTRTPPTYAQRYPFPPQSLIWVIGLTLCSLLTTI